MRKKNLLSRDKLIARGEHVCGRCPRPVAAYGTCCEVCNRKQKAQKQDSRLKEAFPNGLDVIEVFDFDRIKIVDGRPVPVRRRLKRKRR